MNEDTMLAPAWAPPAAAPGSRRQSVRDWMTAPVKTIPAETPISEAYNIMQDCGIRRLPVARDGQLVGIVTLGDLREARATPGGSLGIYDQSDALDRMTVAQAMTAHPFTVPADTPIHVAAGLMLAQKIGCLPVLDAHGEIIGIITESDLFRLLVVQGDRLDRLES
jgi:acetoin utilization protein AcuB